MFTVGIIHKYTYFPLINLLFVSIFVQITIDTGHLAWTQPHQKHINSDILNNRLHPPARVPGTEAKFSGFVFRRCQVGPGPGPGAGTTLIGIFRRVTRYLWDLCSLCHHSPVSSWYSDKQSHRAIPASLSSSIAAFLAIIIKMIHCAGPFFQW